MLLGYSRQSYYQGVKFIQQKAYAADIIIEEVLRYRQHQKRLGTRILFHEMQDKMGRFTELLDENNISYEQQQYKPTESRYIDKGKRKKIIRRIKGDGTGPQQRGESFGQTLERAIQRDAEFQGTTAEEYSGVQPSGPVAGNRLFNKPLKAVTQIADRYYERVFGTKRPKYFGTRGLNEERA